MIKSLRASNFRSYKEADLKFHPNVNVITGENDSGKTNLLRMLDLVINNRPTGTDYISTSGGDLCVELETESKTITRFRNVKWSKKQGKFVAGENNLYKLSGEPAPFKSFGMGVPDLIKQHLNISPVSIAFQLEGPFLLNQPPPDVARHYNNIVNLDIIDTTISNIASTLRSERSTLKVGEADEKELISKLKEYDWLDTAETSLVELEQVQISIEQLETDKSKLFGLMEILSRLERTKQELDTIIQHDKTAIKLQQLSKTIRSLAKDRFDLQELIDKHKKLTEKSQHFAWIIDHEKIVNSLITQNRTIVNLRQESNGLEAFMIQMKQLIEKERHYHSIISYKDKVNELIELREKIGRKTKERNELSAFIERHKKLRDTYTQFDKTIERHEKEFKAALPEMCPIFDVQCDYINEARNQR